MDPYFRLKTTLLQVSNHSSWWAALNYFVFISEVKTLTAFFDNKKVDMKQITSSTAK